MYSAAGVGQLDFAVVVERVQVLVGTVVGKSCKHASSALLLLYPLRYTQTDHRLS